ncbi:MAG: Fic family protein [Akkermansia sp.]
MNYTFREADDRAAGYLYFLNEVKIPFLPHWHQSYVSTKRIRKLEAQDKRHIIETYPNSHWAGENRLKQLEFALKHDGIQLGALYAIFATLDEDELCAYIQSKPRSIYTRRLWFFYEFLTGNTLPIPDLPTGQYIPILDETEYYCLPKGSKVRRQRLFNNLLGEADFCPIVKRKKDVAPFPIKRIMETCKKEVGHFDVKEQIRAKQYLYLKETKSSFAIERETIPASREERYVKALRLAELQDFCTKEGFIQLQAEMLDSRYASPDYRSSQNYVGEDRGFKDNYQPYIHYISPKPEDLPKLMNGLIRTHELIATSKKSVDTDLAEDLLPAHIHAAIIAYAFVFLHPFEDGNGRTHRFIIHNILSLAKIVPEGFPFPISATMKNHSDLYDQSLEYFSQALMPSIRYELSPKGALIVTSDSCPLYQFMDLTAQAESLEEFIQLTAEEEFLSELRYIRSYDQAKKAIRHIVDIPDKRIDLIIRLCHENSGHLSKDKRKSHFAELSDTELTLIESCFAQYFNESR